VLLPIVGIIPLWLIWVRFPRAALWWAAAAALCIGSTALLKIYFYSCPPFAEVRSPSGHTSLSTLVYGGIAVIIAAGRDAVASRAELYRRRRPDCRHRDLAGIAAGP
jgi:membrane-associated phospholipid phosphatase